MVLDAWAASPSRFREDANAEESLALGGYAGRALVELAANAADAARAAGVPGELLIDLIGDELRVANTGTSLTAAGVASLASLRASAKRESGSGTGHFGVGFTAVLTLSEAPRIAGPAGGVVFDRAATAAEVAGLGVPELDAEVSARGGQVPALRLPWPWAPPEDDPIPQGFTTEVRLPLRDPVAAAQSLRSDEGLAEALLWALPELSAVTMLGRRLTRRSGEISRGDIRSGDGDFGDGDFGDGDFGDGDFGDGDFGDIVMISDGAVDRRYRVATAQGTVPALLLADRPVEERGRDRWRISWVLPLGPGDRPLGVGSGPMGSGPPTNTIGAPTTTDEPITLPARLLGTFPVDDTRRRLAPGPLLNELLGQAVQVYLELVRGCAPGDRIFLVPRAGFPAGQVDAELRDAVLRTMSRAPILMAAIGGPLAPNDACMLPGAGPVAAELIGQAIPTLVAWPDRAAGVESLRALGVRTLTAPEVTGALAALDRPADFWQEVYAALDGLGADAEDLADLPIPRRGGGTMIGARGVLVPGPDAVPEALLDAAAAVAPGLRVAASGCTHPLLLRLGAAVADADSVLSDPALHAAIRELRDDLEEFDPDPERLADLTGLVLDLIEQGGRTDPAVLADVLLTDADGEPWPAGDLLLPDAPLARVLRDDADLPTVESRWVGHYDPETLAVLGVRSGFAVRTLAAPPGSDVDLPDLEGWWAAVERPGPMPETFCALVDLDLVAAESWLAALALIAGDRTALDALASDGWPISYSAWWISRHARIDGAAPSDWRLPSAADLAGLYEVLPTGLDPVLAERIGVATSLAGAVAANPVGMLQRWGDPSRDVPSARVAAITEELLAHLPTGEQLDLPLGVRTLSGHVVPADDAMVLDVPWLAQVVSPRLLVPGGADPGRVADLLDLDLASHRVTARVVSGGQAGKPAPVSIANLPGGRATMLAAAAGAGVDGVAVLLDPDLMVGVDDNDPVRVAWWSEGDLLWVDGSPAAVGRAVAWMTGRWSQRHELIAAADDDAVEIAESGLR